MRGTVLVVAGLAAVAAACTSGATHTTSSRAASPTSIDRASARSGAGTVGALATYHWSQLPAAPIRMRSAAAAVWDGQEMLVWGGEDETRGQLLGDGASYNPTNRRWTVLPSSPLGPRTQPAYVWTGRDLFIWGGYPPGHTASDRPAGALYDPRAHRWRTLPQAPIPTSAAMQALWSGREVLLTPRQSTAATSPVSVVAYNPRTNHWRLLPTPPAHRPAEAAVFSAVMVNRQLYLWDRWTHITHPSANGTDFQPGLDLLVYDETTNRWHAQAVHGALDVGQPIWTGHEILAPVISGCALGPSCPPKANSIGLRFHPSGGSQPLSHGPTSDLQPQSVWTGSALLDYNPSRGIGAGQQPDLPGKTAAWDPTTNRWASLQAAPYLSYGQPAAVWTGQRLLMWGAMIRPVSFPAGASPDYSYPRPIGLQFGP